MQKLNDLILICSLVLFILGIISLAMGLFNTAALAILGACLGVFGYIQIIKRG
jgi:hypothetical protein